MPTDQDMIGDGARDDVFSEAASRPGPTARSRRDADIIGVVALGGGLGSLARYGTEQLLPSGGERFPWATFAVNMGGCLAIGVLMVFVTDVWGSRRYARPFLGIGLLGGLTTFSTLVLDVRTLGSAGDWLLVGTYASSTIAGGLSAVWVAMAGTRWVTRAAGRWRKSKGGA